MSLTLFERGVSLAAAAPPSISGSGGHQAKFNVICALAVGLQLSDSETLAALLQSGWNDDCLPPWSIRELEEAIPRIRRDSRKETGYLLKNGHGAKVSKGISGSRKISPPSARVLTDQEAAEKALQRSRWQKAISLSSEWRDQLCHLRGVVRESVDFAADAGLLHFENVYDHGDRKHHPAWVLSQGDFRQARRFDGERWTTKSGGKTKFKNLQGSLASGFFGLIDGPAAGKPVLLVEGVAGYLEAHTAIHWFRSRNPDWIPLAAHSASTSHFANDPQLSQSIAGRQVRIVKDNDATGAKAADGWAEELCSLGCEVEMVSLPAEAKDLGCVINADPEESFPVICHILSSLDAEEVQG